MRPIFLAALCSCCFLSGNARADSSAKPSPGPTFHVQPLDENFPAEELAGPGVEVHPLPGKATSNKRDSSFELPSPAEEKKLFEAAGLTQETKDMDALDQDQLVLRARRSSPEDLAKYYPTYPKQKLKKLTKLLQPKEKATKK